MINDWTGPAQLRQQVVKLWERGHLLGSMLETASVKFPLKLRLKKPDSKAIGAHYGHVRNWIQSIAELRHVRVEYKEVRHPQLGLNSIPDALWIDNLDDALAFIGKRSECNNFQQQLKEMLEHDPRLLHWVQKHPLKVLELSHVWSQLLRLHKSLIAHQGQVLYLRQISIDGVDTKFIESHRKTLGEWLDITLPEEFINKQYSRTRGFARRYGFKDKPLRLRMRSLDPSLPLLSEATPAADSNVVATADITLDVDVIQCLSPSHNQVLITENEINYLALPYLSNTLGIFGAGYGWQALHDIPWLKQCRVTYWGDIDTHGFAILDELRAVLPHVESIMMNHATLMAHQSLWGFERTAAARTLTRLTESEKTLYNDILDQRYAENIRLEQEQIGYHFALAQLEQVLG